MRAGHESTKSGAGVLLHVSLAGLLLVSRAFAADLCLHSALGEGYDSHEGVGLPVQSIGYSSDGAPCIDTPYGLQTFRLSASDVDPDVNRGPLTGPTLYLWTIAGGGYGFWNGLASYAGSMTIEDVQPMNDASFGFSTDPPQLWFEKKLPFDPDVRLPVARLTISSPTDIDANTWGRVKTLYR